MIASIGRALATLVPFLAMTAFAACGGGGTGGTPTTDGGPATGSSSGGTGSSSGGTGSSSGGTGSSSGGSSGSSSSSGGIGSTGVSLSVTSADEPASVAGVTPPAGDFLLVVSITLANTGASPLSTNPVLFSLKTSQSLIVTTSGLTAANACSPTISVAAGGMLSCSLVFELPAGSTPALVVYDDLHGDRAQAPVPALTTSAATCATFASDLNANKPSCVICLGNAGGSDAGSGPCTTQATAYSTSCNVSACADNCVNGAAANQICMCEEACDSLSCQALFEAYVTCAVQSCSSACP
jgi:hypothetical protein